MAEKLAQDPAFAQMTQSLQTGMGNAGPSGQHPASGVPGLGSIDPNAAQEAMSGMFQNPEFMNMAQELGQKIMAGSCAVAGLHRRELRA